MTDAYCRVSTYKDEQLDSLEAQHRFFSQYALKNGYDLIHIYADEGKSGTRLKNRTQLLKLLSEAEKGMFNFVLIKDVSRLARNTVDFLTSIRKLKSLGITVVFVNYDQTTSDSSEFMLTMLSAIAQEESANTSKRVKFGKRLNAQSGKVPNLVFGYDKIDGEIFSLHKNEKQTEAVREIFHMYVNLNMSTGKIAAELNRRGIKTKREKLWTQTAVSRVLSNKIYIGKVINAKEEVADFLSGERRANSEDKWLICDNPELRIISDELFYKAGEIMNKRSETFARGQRSSDKYIFSKRIKCRCCGLYFRRQTRKYKNTYVKWVCSGRNQKGADFCPNKAAVDESELIRHIQLFMGSLIENTPKASMIACLEFNKAYRELHENSPSEKELEADIAKLTRSRNKYMDMYEADIIDIKELREKVNPINENIEKITRRLNFMPLKADGEAAFKNIVEKIFENGKNILEANLITDNIISRIISNIEADGASLDIYIKNINEIIIQ